MESGCAVFLAPFEPAHVERTFGWASDPELRHLFLMRGAPNWEYHLTYWDRALKDEAQRVYAIMFGDLYVGNCGLKNISLRTLSAELWIYVGDAGMRGMGIGAKATRALCDAAFGALGLETIYLHVAGFNTTARKLYERLGFESVPMPASATEWTERDCSVVRMQLARGVR